MIKRVTHVKDFRCFQGWRQRNNAVGFEKLNLLYAPNGTGKSTFAELVSGVPDDPTWSHGMKAVVQIGDDPDDTETVDGPGHWIWDGIRLFSAEYVRRNLRFDAHEEQGGCADAEALLYLGRPTIEQQERREAAQAELERVSTELRDLRKKRASVERKRDRLCTELGSRAHRELGPVSGRFNRGFNKNHVKRALKAPLTPQEELDAARDRDRSLIAGSAPEPIPPVNARGLALGELEVQIVDLLARTVASEALDALVGRPEHEAWVREGGRLHADRDTCLFCEGRITDDRRARLARHFDEGYARLLAELDDAVAQTRLLRSQAEHFSSALPHRTQFFEDMREDYDETYKKVESAVTSFQNGLDRIVEVLEHKRGAMFAPLALPSDIAPVAVDTTGLDRMLGDHNARTDSIADERARAADREFERMLHDVATPIRDHNRQASELTRRIQEQERTLDECQEVLREIPRLGHDPEYFLTELNRDISSLLRRSDLRFVHDDGRYRVLRHDRPARHLSEGERTAIALIYFLTSLAGGGRSLEKTIVIVDDPVSSLDDHLMFGVYSMLIAKLDPDAGLCRQLFVLTHNTVFLRHWSRELKRKDSSTTLHMMKSVGEGADRAPVLVPLNAKRGRDSVILETEYLLLFHSVTHNLLDAIDGTSLDADLRLATSVPNDARKMLEHFLQFRVPEKGGNLTEAVEELLPGKRDLAGELTRFLHSNSHRTPDALGKPILDAAATHVLKGVFTLIRDTDPKHFEGMCTRLGIADRKHRLTLA
ncbi:AAA family ATPase [Nocardiopsis sp. CNT312]|uniref:AAA family ATPase n=1 Tax=Nocardiopsis sp. CNT312 TaxID=1137268 RepID=UPI00048F641E|nr:AAA family ATPase [Nocardiopsis sp. CNT312]